MSETDRIDELVAQATGDTTLPSQQRAITELALGMREAQEALFSLEGELRSLRREYLELRDERQLLQDRVVALEGQRHE